MRDRIRLSIVMILLVIVCVTCGMINYVFSFWAHPWDEDAVLEQDPEFTLPDNPIAFVVEDGQPTDVVPTLGFIDPDGGNFTTRNINNSLTRDHSYFVRDRMLWGPDGNFLVTSLTCCGTMRYVLGEGIPIVITASGETRECRDFTSFVSAWGIDSTHVLITKSTRVGGDSFQYQIVNLSMETCQIEEVIYDGKSTGIGDFAISSDGWIAFENGLGIVVLDDQQKEVFKVDDASSPNWSRDGQWLAYYVYNEGIKIIRRDGTDTQLITDGYNPWWSPDGEWLVYDSGSNIYKINVVTKEQVLLYSGGRYPTWR
jgi:hypothetical protein